jgi:hypothetical protein
MRPVSIHQARLEGQEIVHLVFDDDYGDAGRGSI